MEGSSNNKKFSVTDIERYHAGKMSAQEMHALEKAALDDPFLADAMEGYRHSPNPESELINLKARIGQKIVRRRHRSPVTRIYLFTRVAALVLLIAGSGWFIYKLFIPGNNGLAEAKQESSKVDSSADHSLAKVIVLKKDSVLRPVVIEDKKREDVATLSLKKNKPDQTSGRISSLKSLPSSIEDNTRSDSFGITSVAQAPSSERSEVKKGQQGAFRFNPQAAQSKSKDSGYYVASESTVKEKTLATDSIKNINVALKPDNANLSEVVVTNKISKRKAATMNRTSGDVILDSLEPSQGWNNFNDYIALNIKSPEQLQIKPVTGDVQLSFDVNNEGEPVNIKVEKSLCAKCDEEAIRLLKDGPKWKKKKNRKGKIFIHF